MKQNLVVFIAAISMSAVALAAGNQSVSCFAQETIINGSFPAAAKVIGSAKADVSANGSAQAEFDMVSQSGAKYHVTGIYVPDVPVTMAIAVKDLSTNLIYSTTANTARAQFQIYDGKSDDIMVICNGQ